HEVHRALNTWAEELGETAPAGLPAGVASAMDYVGVSVAPLVGQVAMAWSGPHLLGPVGAVFIALGLGAAD
ncbi:hypothetical protein, partial [Streptomyces roseoverticillatus]